MNADGIIAILGGVFGWFVSPAIARFQVSWKWGEGRRDTPLTYRSALTFSRIVSAAMFALGVWMLVAR